MLKKALRSRSLLYGVVFVLFFIISFTLLDPDFGWHLRAGEYFMAQGIPATDIFTYTAPSFPWIDHEWLSDIFVALLYRIGGYGLLAAVFAALWTFGFWLIGRKVSGVIVIVAVLAVLPFAGIRTVTWSFVFLALTICLLRLPRFRKAIVLPLFVLWANLHGSFIVGLIYVLYEAIRRRSKALALLLLLCVAVTFINPYGWQLYVEVWRTLSDGELHWQITEWAPAAFPLVALPYILLWIGSFAVLDGKKASSYIKPDVVALLAALSSVRNLPLFVVLSLESLEGRSKRLLAMIPKDIDYNRRRFLKVMAIAGIGVVALTTIVTFHTFSWNRESTYPSAAVADLISNPCSGNLFNDYNYGGYLIWKLPNQKVYIDGRMPSWQVNGVKYLDIYHKVLNDASFRRAQFAQYYVTCALVRTNDTAIVQSLKRDGWSSKYYQDGSVLLRQK